MSRIPDPKDTLSDTDKKSKAKVKAARELVTGWKVPKTAKEKKDQAALIAEVYAAENAITLEEVHRAHLGT